MTHVPWHEDDLQMGEEVQGVESVEFHSVGIDIGTTTTHFLISRMLARRQGGSFSSKFKIIEREIVYRSPIRLTPYETETSIDADEIDSFIQSCYEEAGFTPEDIDTGTVITTGEATRKENANAIIDLFSEQSGKFVCATAGANLETLMSAHGSGAVELSLGTDQDVLHVDIGGGTTKIAYIVDGIVEETVSVNVGARLVELDDDGNVVRVEDAARKVADDIGLNVQIGDPLSPANRERLADRFSEVLFAVVDNELSPLADSLLVTELAALTPFDVMTFAGGAADYVYGRTSEYYNDLGPEFGDAIRNAVEAREEKMEELDVSIRATAIGSTQHTVQVSGNTLTITDVDLLPLHNVPMVPLAFDEDDAPEEITEELLDQLYMYDVDQLHEPFAYGFHLHGRPTSEFLGKLLDAAIEGWNEADGDHPLILAFESDTAMSAGRRAKKLIDQPVISIDGVDLAQFGYIDIGEPIEYTEAVPVTVKSLVFEG